MDGIEINYRLRKLGMSQAKIARTLGVASGVVSNVIHDRTTAYAVASHIAQLLECEIEDLWPTRYVFKPRKTTTQNDGKNTCVLLEGEVKCPNHPD